MQIKIGNTIICGPIKKGYPYTTLNAACISIPLLILGYRSDHVDIFGYRFLIWRIDNRPRGNMLSKHEYQWNKGRFMARKGR